MEEASGGGGAAEAMPCSARGARYELCFRREFRAHPSGRVQIGGAVAKSGAGTLNSLLVEGKDMCLVFVCDEDERVIGRQAPPGACPYCGGMVQAMDVQSQWRLCFVPLYFKTKRRFYYTLCSRRLVTP